MEELTAEFSGAFQVTRAPNTTDAPNPRFQSYYKARTSVDQAERRRRILDRQKESRMDYLTHVRRLVGDAEEEDDLHEDMDTLNTESQKTKKQYTKQEKILNAAHNKGRSSSNMFRDQLMLSEWLLEVPDNFETEWMMVPCPVGKRNLVIASGGVTRAYAKSGYCRSAFPSHLPGGCRKQARWKDEVTILDCVFVEHQSTFYVLDVMCWKYQPFYDTETDFRKYWLQSKFEEMLELRTIHRVNKFAFEALPAVPCSKDALTDTLATPMNIELDGLLFYNKKTYYTFGATPLVLWLKSYMMPEILNVAVPENLLSQAPQTYTGFTHHVETVREQRQRGVDVIAPGKLAASMEQHTDCHDDDDDTVAMDTNSARGGKKKRNRKQKSQQQSMEGVADVQETTACQESDKSAHLTSEHFGQHQFGHVNRPAASVGETPVSSRASSGSSIADMTTTDMPVINSNPQRVFGECPQK